jgi:hypothetical protein
MTIKFDLISYNLEFFKLGFLWEFEDFEKNSKHDGIEVE